VVLSALADVASVRSSARCCGLSPVSFLRLLSRLTNAFSKALEGHMYAFVPQFLSYRFVRKHAMLQTTPAVAAGIADRPPMSMLDSVAVLETEQKLSGSRPASDLPAIGSR
jgi:hypothetical protein